MLHNGDARAAYSAAQLAERWGCSTTHIHNLIRKEQLQAFKIGTLIRIRKEEVERVEGCALSFIGGNGPSPATIRQAKSGDGRFGPVIAEPPRGSFGTTALRRRAKR